MARPESNGTKESTATIGFEAAAVRGSAILHREAILRSLSTVKDNRWFTATDSRGKAEPKRNGASPTNEDGHLPNGPWRGKKSQLWEGGHREPFIARWPGHIAPGTTSDDLVCLVDLAATAAAVAGEKLPDGAAPDSFNLLPTLLGQPKQMKRDTLVVMSGNGDLAIRQGQWKCRANLALADGWQSGPKKPNQPAQPALFDLSTDQGETKNFAQQTALRDSAFLQSGASSQVVLRSREANEAKDKPAIARRMAELLEKAQSAKSTRPSSP